MKIEKISEKQIRCTITKKDLEKHGLKLEEIAYGNEKVKTLFRDMMRTAATKFGFEVEDTPLMIEVVPFSECAVIDITKVKDPDELDTRFSKFAPSVHGLGNPLVSALDEVFGKGGGNSKFSDFMKSLERSMEADDDADDDEENDTPEESSVVIPERSISVTNGNREECYYSFTGLNTLMNVSGILDRSYNATNVLYKNEAKNLFLLGLTRGGHTEEEFKTILTLLEEYASPVPDNGYLKYFIAEHCNVIIPEDAIHTLASL